MKSLLLPLGHECINVKVNTQTNVNKPTDGGSPSLYTCMQPPTPLFYVLRCKMLQQDGVTRTRKLVPKSFPSHSKLSCLTVPAPPKSFTSILHTQRCAMHEALFRIVTSACLCHLHPLTRSLTRLD